MTLFRWLLVLVSFAAAAGVALWVISSHWPEGGAPLVSASPYTEAVGQGANKIYRARFVGFASKDAAESACDALKQRSYDCMLLPDHG